MNFLITGITGFAGPHLANLLISKGHNVYGLVRHSNGRETDILDIVLIVNFIMDELEYIPIYDINYDNEVNILDIISLVNIILN